MCFATPAELILNRMPYGMAWPNLVTSNQENRNNQNKRNTFFLFFFGWPWQEQATVTLCR